VTYDALGRVKKIQARAVRSKALPYRVEISSQSPGW
jgi:hypothetical protein